MKKSKNRSRVSLPTVKSDDVQCEEEIHTPPLDVLNIEVFSIYIPNEDPKHLDIKITYCDQIVLSRIITSSNIKKNKEDKAIARGQMNYDPADYEKMAVFADNPLTVKVKIFESVQSNFSATTTSSVDTNTQLKTKLPNADVHCCNVDILPIFLDTPSLLVRKRLEPMLPRSVLETKSWDNLPLITFTLKANRNPENIHHHTIFKDANLMKITLIGCYNMNIPYDESCMYTAVTKLPLCHEKGSSITTYNNVYRMAKRFDNLNFYPHWESLRYGDEYFTKHDAKFRSTLEELQNEENINLKYYLNVLPKNYTTIWASFHRTLLLKETEVWLVEHLRHYKWPFEVHISGGLANYTMMAFLDLFQLLYPGEKVARLVVPLQWKNAQSMVEACGCDLQLTVDGSMPSAIGTVQKINKVTTESTPINTNRDEIVHKWNTGSDDNNAFMIVEVALGRPLKKPVVPPHISNAEIKNMLLEMERLPVKRECTARGQLDRDWQSTVRSAANSLRRIPYYGLTDFCMIDRQLSGTRTRVELVTSFWQEGAIYANNNFVVKDFVHSDDTFEEMVLMTHSCLMRLTNETLGVTENRPKVNQLLRAARHARQLQDFPHAVELYFQVVAENEQNADLWRELATCLKNVDDDWSNACIVTALSLNPRHPLSLLSKASTTFEKNPDEAEIFFVALLALYPFWLPLLAVASAYFYHQQLFHMSENIMDHIKQMSAKGLAKEMKFPRAWEHELGDWWDSTPLLPGTSIYFDAADLLLRLRGVALAEICIARALVEVGESAVYYHLLALCCRLKEDCDNALCHLKQGMEKFDEFNYLKSLESECHHKNQNFSAAIASLDKHHKTGGVYMTLLSLPPRESLRCRTVLEDLLRRHPNAYAWIAFAEHWLAKSKVGEGGDATMTEEQKLATTYSIACAVQALKWDRQAGKAWNILARLVKPSARRLYYREMAAMCKHALDVETSEFSSESKQSLCYRLGKVLRECRCTMCDNLTLKHNNCYFNKRM